MILNSKAKLKDIFEIFCPSAFLPMGLFRVALFVEIQKTVEFWRQIYCCLFK